MKKEIHSKEYRLVVFEDSSCNYSFLTKSTVKTDKTVQWEDGKEYPLYKLDISDKAKEIIKYTIYGMALIILSFVIVKTVISLLIEVDTF